MVQPEFSSAPRKAAADSQSPTAALDKFLDNQHQSYFEELYKSEAVCLCILRFLAPVHRYIVLHYLWAHHAIKTAEVKALLRMPDSVGLHEVTEALRPLIDRKIVGDMQKVAQKTQYSVNDTFKRGLRNAMTGMGKSNSFGVPYDPTDEKEVPGIDDLLEYGEVTWESILKYMVSSGLSQSLTSLRPRPQVLQLLHTSGLMTDNTMIEGGQPNLDRLTITSKGFQFLLEDRQTQLWQVVMYYLAMREQSVLQDLEYYGFVLKRPKDNNGARTDVFFPTHLATSLCSGDLAGQLGGAEGEEKRFLILETNYKIYAYTSNELEIAILNLFVNIRIRYPNLVVGKLDRKHVKTAMEKGISAHQIIAYLSSHAHSQMHSSPPPLLHPTIVDQLHLWDKERNRLKTDDAIMFEFFSKELYDDTEAEAHRYDGVLLALPSQKLLFVNPDIKDGIRDFIQNQKRQLQLRVA